MAPVLKQQTGFSLFEVLVALFVLSVGLLGLAHLQLTTLKHAQTAEFRTQASILAADILDKMRTNQAAARAGEFNTDFGNLAVSPPPRVISPSPALMPLEDDRGDLGDMDRSGGNSNLPIGINPDSRDPTESNGSPAQADLALWLERIEQSLPQGEGAIDCPSVPAAEVLICQVTLRWVETQIGDADDEYGELGYSEFSFSGAI